MLGPIVRPPCARTLADAIRRFASSTGQSTATINFNNDTQDALVNSLIKQELVRSPRVEAVLRALDRRDFTSTHMGIPAHVSYSDSQVPIGQGQSISAPSLHAICLGLLEGHVGPGAAVLDVGAGSGYLTACFSLLVGPAGRVAALERHERLVEQAGWALACSLSAHVGDMQPTHGSPGAQERDTHSSQPQQLGSQGVQRTGVSSGGRLVVRLHNVEMYHGNVLDDAALEAVGACGPFHAIHVGAAAREVPGGLLALLRPGGRMVLPLGPPVAMQALTVIDKAADGSISSSRVRDVKLPPLVPPNAERPL
ncbi:hypothetical protein Agub_g2147 [Astrephomene gubernaculifera]|uniref:protein-L-isoaspartate(D-aspartate) O-methyltransferase n=1 Tax=Astrephomene gubernaculifera TaxID=47775 RepID=A0AAD3DGL6_9CHLO|nr:hypothetical protein Agub_g2147 [Astrephomene gubernaculifera]